MSVPPEIPTTQTAHAGGEISEHSVPVHLEPRFTAAADSQLLIMETAFRLLSVWALRAAGSAPGST